MALEQVMALQPALDLNLLRRDSAYGTASTSTGSVLALTYSGESGVSYIRALLLCPHEKHFSVGQALLAQFWFRF
jgi:hypothetical protein|uniref:Uncharacterized protein n=2 Tax=Picea TaxID=3328 RepID=A0A124GMW6_PICGL|nr:hypothetical protein ABT39_MTgene5990 [Picea glauca]QHR91467.1 hypothetical protein Q903MT_gene5501 [Picea sitchensis]